MLNLCTWAEAMPSVSVSITQSCLFAEWIGPKFRCSETGGKKTALEFQKPSSSSLDISERTFSSLVSSSKPICAMGCSGWYSAIPLLILLGKPWRYSLLPVPRGLTVFKAFSSQIELQKDQEKWDFSFSLIPIRELHSSLSLVTLPLFLYYLYVIKTH